MPIRGANPLKKAATRMEVKLRSRQSREAQPAYVTGVSNGQWTVTGDGGATPLASWHGTGGLTVGQQVQQTRSNVPMFDSSYASPATTATAELIQPLGDVAITPITAYPAKALQYTDIGGGA